MDNFADSDGLWWCEEKSIPVGGCLSVSPTGTITLDIPGGSLGDADQREKIFGASSDGKFITLINSIRTNHTSSSSTGITSERFVSDAAFFGERHFLNSGNRFVGVNIVTKNLASWTGLSGFDYKGDSNDPEGSVERILYRIPEVQVFKTAKGSIKLGAASSTSISVFPRGVTKSEKIYLEYLFGVPGSIEDLRFEISNISYFLRTLSGHDQDPTELHSIFENGLRLRTYFSTLKSKTIEEGKFNPNEVLFWYDDIKTRFEAMFEAWQSLSVTKKNAILRCISIIASKEFYFEDQIAYMGEGIKILGADKVRSDVENGIDSLLKRFSRKLFFDVKEEMRSVTSAVEIASSSRETILNTELRSSRDLALGRFFSELAFNFYCFEFLGLDDEIILGGMRRSRRYAVLRMEG
jgi:hypothetical protein